MGKHWRVLGAYSGTATAFEAFAVAALASPYTPTDNGRLIGLRVIVSNTAATSLVEGFIIRLTCTKFTPNMIEVAGSGNGLHTAVKEDIVVFDFPVDQPVAAGVPIALEGRHLIAAPVTPVIILMGQFA